MARSDPLQMLQRFSTSEVACCYPFQMITTVLYTLYVQMIELYVLMFAIAPLPHRDQWDQEDPQVPLELG